MAEGGEGFLGGGGAVGGEVERFVEGGKDVLVLDAGRREDDLDFED